MFDHSGYDRSGGFAPGTGVRAGDARDSNDRSNSDAEARKKETSTNRGRSWNSGGRETQKNRGNGRDSADTQRDNGGKRSGNRDRGAVNYYQKRERNQRSRRLELDRRNAKALPKTLKAQAERLNEFNDDGTERNWFDSTFGSNYTVQEIATIGGEETHTLVEHSFADRLVDGIVGFLTLGAIDPNRGSNASFAAGHGRETTYNVEFNPLGVVDGFLTRGLFTGALEHVAGVDLDEKLGTNIPLAGGFASSDLLSGRVSNGPRPNPNAPFVAAFSNGADNRYDSGDRDPVFPKIPPLLAQQKISTPVPKPTPQTSATLANGEEVAPRFSTLRLRRASLVAV